MTADFYTIATMLSQTPGGATGGNNFIDGDKKLTEVTWEPDYVAPKPGSTYNYRVAAYNTAGMSTWSLPVQAVTGGVPGAPSNLVAVLGAANSVDLTWIAATGTVEGYRVERKLSTDTNFSAIATLGPGILTYNDAGTLVAGSTYDYRVFAFNAASGDSLPSSVATILIPATAPADPTNLAATVTWNAGAPSVSLTWSDNAANETGYTVERALDPEPNVWSIIATTGAFAGSGAYADNTVAPNETYHYRVQAFVNPGSVISNYSNVATVVIPNQIPEAPSGLTVTKTLKDRITLGWLDNSTNEDRFEIQRAPDDNGTPGAWGASVSLPANTTTYTDTGLTRKTTYWYQVRACNANGCSAWTAAVSGTTK